MARVWIEDRAGHAEYQAAVAKAKGTKRQPPGRWRVRWYDPDNKQKAKTFGTLPPAEAYKQQLLERLGDGSYRDPAAGRAVIAAVAEEWFAAAQVELKRSSRARYRRALDSYILPKWGTTPVGRIRHEDVAEWIGQLSTTAGLSGRPLGSSVVRGLHRVLHMVLAWAVRTDRIATNPATGVPLPRKGLTDHVYLDHDQVERLAAAAGRYRPLVLLLAYTGLRWGEASALRVGRVDLDARRAHVVTAFAEDNGEIYADTPKDHERRSVPLPLFLVSELKPVVDGRDTGELLFSAPRSGPLRAHNFRSREFAAAVKAAGLAKLGVTPHKLRHTAASLAIAAGADVKVVQQMLGHASATITLDTYGHLFPDRLDEVANALDAQRMAAEDRRRSNDAKKGQRS